MPRLLQINITANWGSHGRIAEMLGQIALAEGWESYIAYGRWKNKSQSQLYHIGNDLDECIHALSSRIFDNQGLLSRKATTALIRYIENIKPDIIHLHNIHGYYLNYPLLFKFLSQSKIPVVWTLHDCWPYTGHCAHYMNAHCEKWQTHCSHCPNKKAYPTSWLFDRSFRNFSDKRKAFLSVPNLTLVTVSKWMGEDLRHSFFKGHDIRQIYNGINTELFLPSKERNILTRKLGISQDKKIILGVASNWYHKGLEDFIKLSQMISNHFHIILIGLSSHDLKSLPSNITGIARTQSISELRSFYSAADVFFNPTWEDNFPTTTLEALACGTPAVVYATGGCPEAIIGNTGYTVKQGAICDALQRIEYICSKGKEHYTDSCRNSVLNNFDQQVNLRQYYNIYKEKLGITE